MKVGDYVRFPSGVGRGTLTGIVMEICDNPADVALKETLSAWKEPRKIARIFSEGKMNSSWLNHVKVLKPIEDENGSR